MTECENQVYRQICGSTEVNLIQLQEQISELKYEVQDLTARDNAKDQRLKEIKAEANQARIGYTEKISELKYQNQDKEKEIDKLREKLLEYESLLDAKDEQLETLEEDLKNAQPDGSDNNHYAELIDVKVRYAALYTRLKNYEARIEALNENTLKLTTEVDSLKETIRELETEKILNQ